MDRRVDIPCVMSCLSFSVPAWNILRSAGVVFVFTNPMVIAVKVSDRNENTTALLTDVIAPQLLNVESCWCSMNTDVGDISTEGHKILAKLE